LEGDPANWIRRSSRSTSLNIATPSGIPDGFETRPHHCRQAGVMRSVELTKSGFVHGGRVLPSAVTLGLCPLGQIWLHSIDPWTDQASLTSSRLSNCSLVKENCMPPNGRNAGSGMVTKLPTLSTPSLTRFSMWTTCSWRLRNGAVQQHTTPFLT